MKSIRLSLFILLTSLSITSYSQSEKVQAAFIYNFTKYINWPASHSSGDFVISIVGNAPIAAPLKAMASAKKVGSQPIVVKTHNSASEIGKCNIAIVPKSASGSLGDVVSKVGSSGALIITEQDGLAKAGSAINFIIKDGKQRFELNEGNVKKAGLNVSADLKKLAIIVN